jgi:hypothetical protein
VTRRRMARAERKVKARGSVTFFSARASRERVTDQEPKMMKLTDRTSVLPAHCNSSAILMWAWIGLVCVVLGRYAGFCGTHDTPRFERLPDPETAPLPPAPVGPADPGAGMPDAELVA